MDNHLDVFLNSSDKTVRKGSGASAAVIGDTTPNDNFLQIVKNLQLKAKKLPPKNRNLLKLLFPLENSVDKLIQNTYALNIIKRQQPNSRKPKDNSN